MAAYFIAFASNMILFEVNEWWDGSAEIMRPKLSICRDVYDLSDFILLLSQKYQLAKLWPRQSRDLYRR